ncbi:MAG: hypothetical protein OJF49_002721 [Ktedonobacterales bacterium]|jgi:hypothetical protein|nr:MAG: hypothetical protein OJF49_002721 [Ktedonobacterales bacterium]
MNGNIIWTPTQVTGSILALSIIFAPGISLYMRVKDTHGPVIFGQPPHEWLRLVHQHPRPWRWATISFICIILTTLFGLALLAGLLRDAGDPGFSQAGLLAFALGTALWVIVLAARLTIDPWAGKEMLAKGAIPDVYTALSKWNGAMFVIFTILAFAGVMSFGAAILATNLLPHWLGWATLIYSLAGLTLLAITRDSLPIMHHLMPFVIGIILLL